MTNAVGRPKEDKPSIVEVHGRTVLAAERIIRFRGRALILVPDPFDHYVPLTTDHFGQIALRELGGLTRSKLGDAFNYVALTADDMTPYQDMFLFGKTQPDNDDFEEFKAPTVWDGEYLNPTTGSPSVCVWRSPYKPVVTHEPIPFVLELAGGDKDLYGDIMQSIAPLIMRTKPDGVIWWVGDGANGKSTLMDALYRLFPGQFSSLNVKQLTDGRDTPALNGVLANVVRESSEGRIDDTQVYKSIGTHEDFSIHKFHSQDSILIRGNLHHIFSGNNIPVFNDKGHSARRRTVIIPFDQVFESDPEFEKRTFTPDMFGNLLWEMMRYAIQIQKQGFKYKWSARTLAAKAGYDANANSAEEYARHIINEGVVAFLSFQPLKVDYENWCAENGMVPLGINAISRVFKALGFERISYRNSRNGTTSSYRLPSVEGSDLVSLNLLRPGLFTLVGFSDESDQKTKTTNQTTLTKKQETFLNGSW